MNVPSNTNLYLDSNFLVAYFVPHHSDHHKSVITFANLLSQNNTLHLSPLVIDETLHAIRNEYNALRKKNKLLPQPHAFFFNELKGVIDQLIQFSQIKIRQFEGSINNGCSSTVDNIKKYSLAPRDAFHLAYMQDWGVDYIVTNDSNFTSLAKDGISHVSY